MNPVFIITFAAVIAIAATASVPVPAEKDCSRTGFTPFSVRNEMCGSDGVTYVNPLHLLYSNCLNNQNVTVVKEGYCDDEEETRDKEAHRKFMQEYANEIRKAIKEGRPIPYIADAAMPNLDDYPEEEEEKP